MGVAAPCGLLAHDVADQVRYVCFAVQACKVPQAQQSGFAFS